MKRANALIVMALLLCSAAAAGVVEPTPNLPPNGTSYDGPGWTFNVGGVPIQFLQVSIFNFSANTLPPQNVGDSATHSLSATIAGDFSVNGGPATHSADPANIVYSIMKVSGPNGSSLGTFDTQMTALDVSGLPGGAMLRIDPITPSVGQTTESDAGGGQFRIDSFFDIFVDLSLDGGQTWTPSSGASRQTLDAAPEPGSLLLLGTGLVWIVRRNVHRRSVVD